ncbi:PP2C family protein-serine/threonine phosphatase [Streptomyces coffeae]|uniref:Serine/threonine-protein phosphatase n=1 Tax=Streptomyces coffeae TaxID=621382 RepID=A0ABS1N8P4_9ACTN|nr:PP2C family protein-serine/threonine phosphatase [Streptomyces coffeae]MBL1096455.1 serine/threonine-protein phosphatase [Streptomyces coffeae]
MRGSSAGGGPPGAAPPCGRRAAAALLCGWLLSIVIWELSCPYGPRLIQLLAASPAIACAFTGSRRCMLLGGASALFALVPLGIPGPESSADHPCARVGACVAILTAVAAGYLTTGRHSRLVRELERAQEVAAAAQQAVLRPLPPRLEGIELAGGHLSASRGAAVGGDLYEVLATPYGLRAVIGDARGHGLAAIGTVAAVLGSFREAAHEERGLGDVLRRLDRALERHLRERAGGAYTPESPEAEEFVTVLLLEVGPDGEVTALNCGHPWPYRLLEQPVGPATARQTTPGEVLPPLGLFPLPAELPLAHCAPLPPGDALVLHTDGAEDARDADGTFFPLRRALAEAAGAGPIVPATVVEGVRSAVLRHTGGRLADDIALVALRNDRRPLSATPSLSVPTGDARHR